jgi:hypothetical protein
MDAHERIRTTPWQSFARVFTDGSSQQRYLRETIFGRRRSPRYFQITTDPVRRPPESTWQLMTNLPGTLEESVPRYKVNRPQEHKSGFESHDSEPLYFTG